MNSSEARGYIVSRLAIASRIIAGDTAIHGASAVAVNVRPQDEGQPLIDVHGVHPRVLADLAEMAPADAAHRDADDLIRWVTIDRDGFAITYHRR